MKGTILIADITGYTQFISATDIEHANFVVVNLFSAMLEKSPKNLRVMEVEGDALFCWFPADNGVSSVGRLFDLVQQQFRRFVGVLQWFIEVRGKSCDCHACVQARDLKIKFLLHYGQAGVYQLANFEKIAGLDVVIAHRLLKNSVPVDEYVLITQALQTEQLPGGGKQWHQGEDTYPIIGTIPYSYRKLDRSLVQESIPPPFVDRIDRLSSHL